MTNTITLRGHHLKEIQKRYRTEKILGRTSADKKHEPRICVYGEYFTKNLKQLYHKIVDQPNLRIKVTDSLDSIC